MREGRLRGRGEGHGARREEALVPRGGDPRPPGARATLWLENLDLGEGAARYGSAPPLLGGVLGPEQSVLERSLERLLSRGRQPDSRRIERRAVRLARRLAEVVRAGQRPPQGETVSACASHCGLSGRPLIRWQIIRRRHEGWYLDRLRDPLRALLSLSAQAPRVLIGIGAAELEEPGAPLAVVLLTIPVALELDPLPRHAQVGERLTLTGRQLRAEPLQLWLSTPSGGSWSTPLRGGNGQVQAQLPPIEEGAQRLEVVGADGLPRAALTLWGGEERPPRRLTLTTSPPPQRSALAAQLWLWRALRELRQSAGRPPLRLSWRARRLARSLAKGGPPVREILTALPLDERQLDALLFPRPSEAELQREAKQRSYEVAQLHLFQLIGRSPTAILERLLMSASARATLLDPAWERLGFILQRQRSETQPIFTLSLLLSRLPFALRLDSDRSSLYQEVQARRRRGRLPRLPISSGLEEVAQEMSEGLAEGHWGRKRLAARSAHLFSLRHGERPELEVMATRLSTPSSLAEEPLWYDPRVKSAALGLTQRGPGEPLWATILFRLR